MDRWKPKTSIDIVTNRYDWLTILCLSSTTKSLTRKGSWSLYTLILSRVCLLWLGGKYSFRIMSKKTILLPMNVFFGILLATIWPQTQFAKETRCYLWYFTLLPLAFGWEHSRSRGSGCDQLTTRNRGWRHTLQCQHRGHGRIMVNSRHWSHRIGTGWSSCQIV